MDVRWQANKEYCDTNELAIENGRIENDTVEAIDQRVETTTSKSPADLGANEHDNVMNDEGQIEKSHELHENGGPIDEGKTNADKTNEMDAKCMQIDDVDSSGGTSDETAFSRASNGSSTNQDSNFGINLNSSPKPLGDKTLNDGQMNENHDDIEESDSQSVVIENVIQFPESMDISSEEDAMFIQTDTESNGEPNTGIATGAHDGLDGKGQIERDKANKVAPETADIQKESLNNEDQRSHQDVEVVDNEELRGQCQPSYDFAAVLQLDVPVSLDGKTDLDGKTELIAQIEIDRKTEHDRICVPEQPKDGPAFIKSLIMDNILSEEDKAIAKLAHGDLVEKEEHQVPQINATESPYTKEVTKSMDGPSTNGSELKSAKSDSTENADLCSIEKVLADQSAQTMSQLKRNKQELSPTVAVPGKKQKLTKKKKQAKSISEEGNSAHSPLSF